MKKTTQNIIKFIIAIATVVGLYLYSNRKKIFLPNPYKLNYTKVANLEQILEKGESPSGEKTFFITLGSRSCPACTQLYKVMHEYNKLAKGKTTKDGFIPFWNTDVDLEIDQAQQFAYDHILDNTFVRWDQFEEGGTFEKLADIGTPTTFFIKNGEVQEIIFGSTLEVEKVINYVKRNI